MKWKNKGHEYDDVGELLLNPNVSYYIWGAGTFGKVFYDKFSTIFKIKGFVDQNVDKCDKEFCGLQVYSPEKFSEIYDNEVILVSTGLTRSVYNILNGMGLKRFKKYFHIDEAASIYEYKKNNRLYMNDIDIAITQKCTLKCEYCNAFIPLLKEKKDMSMEEIKNSIENYFKWVDEVNILSLSGGDAMMHKSFVDVLKWVGDTYYPHKVNNIEVYCNAVIVPDIEVLDLFKKFKVIYRFTDYHGRAGTQKIDLVEKILKQNRILYDHADLESWYDSGYPQESNGITNEDALIDFCTACDRKSCHSIWGDKFFSCAMCKCAEDIGYCKTEESDYFDLSDFDSNRKIELLEFYMGYSEKGYYNYCKKCNGGMNVNKYPIIQGEQIL